VTNVTPSNRTLVSMPVAIQYIPMYQN
jgi:hypothetical protein